MLKKLNDSYAQGQIHKLQNFTALEYETKIEGINIIYLRRITMKMNKSQIIAGTNCLLIY